MTFLESTKAPEVLNRPPKDSDTNRPSSAHGLVEQMSLILPISTVVVLKLKLRKLSQAFQILGKYCFSKTAFS